MAIQAEHQAQGRLMAPTVTWDHVKAHSGHPWNELVDSLATQAIREAKAYLALYAPPPPHEGGRPSAQAASGGVPSHEGDNAAPGAVLMGRLLRHPGEEFVREAQAGLYKGPQYPTASSQGWE
eukprot:5433363-Alexandrium_andersonii.AAC.1